MFQVEREDNKLKKNDNISVNRFYISLARKIENGVEPPPESGGAADLGRLHNKEHCAIDGTLWQNRRNKNRLFD